MSVSISPMAITSSAKKAIRSSARKRVYNDRRVQAMRNAVKEIKKLTVAGKKKEAEALLPKAFQALDKAAKEHTIKKGNADRKKSRLAAMVKKIA